jgi:tetratricopeptide (TPR) repeat protein
MNQIISKLVIAAGVIIITGEAAFCAVGSLTTPPSATQSGLTPNPNSRGVNAGNDIVTGNVGGGREFRGVVPYGSSTYIQAPQNSSNIDSFIRRSTGSPYTTDRSPGVVQPYYSPYQSVSSLSSRSPGNYSSSSSSALQLPQMSPLKKPSEFGLVPLEEARQLQQQKTSTLPQTVESATPESLAYSNYRPLTSTPLEMESYISEQIKSTLYPTEQQAQGEEKQPSALEKLSQSEVLKKSPFEPTAQPTQPQEPGKIFEPVEPGLLSEQASREAAAKAPTVFDLMQKTLQDEFQKTLREREAAKGVVPEANQPSEANAPGTTASISPAMAKAIVGYSTTFATKATDRFNELMKAAEAYIKQKQYYKAADAYSLAAVYQPGNPLPYAGKAHALFGAGEYMSSAYFLSRAIEIFPDYTRFKIDLPAIFGDKDLLEKRIADIKEWQERTQSPELQFLLAYIYLETGQLEMAQRMTNGALVNMPQSRALQTLDRVIRLAIEQADKSGTP